MSATLRIADFSQNRSLFPSAPPVININARQHPVTIHFNRRTPGDYVTESIKKATKIHARLPEGGILIFLTGQDEIMTVCRKLEMKFSRKAIDAKKSRSATSSLRISDHDLKSAVGVEFKPSVSLNLSSHLSVMCIEYPFKF